MNNNTVLEYMLKNDVRDHERYMISHYLLENPKRIDVQANEVVYIDNITLVPRSNPYWLEFHSATDNRLLYGETSLEQVSRHKGHIYFKSRRVKTYKISFVKLTLIQ